DGDFEDSGEEVFSGSGSSTVNGSFTPPAGTAGVITRMRVSMSYSTYPPICGTFTYGEVEDYTVEISGGVVEPPVADFTASATIIYEGDSVDFTDLSTGNPTSWSWTFDGGTPSSSSQQNPTVTYNTACRTYTVSLTVSNSAGSDTETKTDYIAVDEELPTVGNTTVFGSTSVSAYRRAMPFTMPENGTIISVTMYHIGGSGSMILGVYDGEDTPQNRLGVTETTAVSGSTGWQTIELTTPVSVESGSTIWLAWVYENNPGIAYQTGSPGRYQSASTWSGGMPDPFGSGSQADYIYSIHANYSPLHVNAEVLDEITLSMWEQENFEPPLEVTTEVPPLDETVIKMDVYLPVYSNNCNWSYLEMRINRDGNIALVNMEQFSSSEFASVAGISHTEVSLFWKWGRICCLSQVLICIILQKLFPYVDMECIKCFKDCVYFRVEKPCHSCGYYGGSDVLCGPFGSCG
ncbi:MAG: PKD domain-containing protein, partial [Candidatus Aminicenantes bacterium]